MRHKAIVFLLILGLMLAVQPAFAQKAVKGKAASSQPAQEQKPAVDPPALEVLQKACDTYYQSCYQGTEVCYCVVQDPNQ